MSLAKFLIEDLGHDFYPAGNDAAGSGKRREGSWLQSGDFAVTRFASDCWDEPGVHSGWFQPGGGLNDFR